jgi:Leucine-rich repeat (LRR) protein
LPEFENLQWLNCGFTGVSEIPLYPQLTELDCTGTNVHDLPCGMTDLECLECSDTHISELPKDLTSLYILNAANTFISEIPRELTNLYKVDISDTLVTEIPKELTGLDSLTCFNTKVTKIPSEIYLGELISDIKIIEYPYEIIGYKKYGNILINNTVDFKESSFTKLQRFFRFKKKLPTLWKIAEYYTARKYSPENILLYISLD